MPYSFSAYGHPNITAKHKTTLEFTKDKELTKRGDCIIGVNSDFDFKKLKDFIKDKKDKRIKITIKTNNLTQTINCELNKDFNDKKEIVIRKSDFVSKRTLGIKANKACVDLNKKLVNKLKDNKLKIFIEIS